MGLHEQALWPVSLITPTESLLVGQLVLGQDSEAAVWSWVFPDTRCLADTHGLSVTVDSADAADSLGPSYWQAQE